MESKGFPVASRGPTSWTDERNCCLLRIGGDSCCSKGLCKCCGNAVGDGFSLWQLCPEFGPVACQTCLVGRKQTYCRCPKGHTMVLCITLEERRMLGLKFHYERPVCSITCDKCHSYNASTPFLTCPECDYDVCGKCLMRGPVHEGCMDAQSVTQPERKPVVLRKPVIVLRTRHASKFEISITLPGANDEGSVFYPMPQRRLFDGKNLYVTWRGEAQLSPEVSAHECVSCHGSTGLMLRVCVGESFEHRWLCHSCWLKWDDGLWKKYALASIPNDDLLIGQKIYPYIFYETPCLLKQTFVKIDNKSEESARLASPVCRVVKQNIASFLDGCLLALGLGLDARLREDFVTYWLGPMSAEKDSRGVYLQFLFGSYESAIPMDVKIEPADAMPSAILRFCVVYYPNREFVPMDDPIPTEALCKHRIDVVEAVNSALIEWGGCLAPAAPSFAI